jgi:hypothetical protein
MYMVRVSVIIFIIVPSVYCDQMSLVLSHKLRRDLNHFCSTGLSFYVML